MEWSSRIETFLQLLAAGLIQGCNYGLMCAGLGLIFGVMRVINFAQGDFMTLGMYAGLLFTAWAASLFSGLAIGAFGWAMLGALFAGVVAFFAGSLVHRFLVGRVSGVRAAGLEDAGHAGQLILTLGLSLVLQNGALMLFGSTPVTIRNSLSGRSWEAGPLWGEDVSVFVNQARTWSALVAVAVAIGLALLMGRTRMGRRLRAAADNPRAALLMGVDVDRAHRTAFGLGVAVTTIAGAALATYLPFQPYTGLDFVVIMYAGVVLGGMGSIGGAFWGGLVIGLVQQMSTLILPVQLQNTAIFVVFLFVLLLRPQGLFGRTAERA